MSEKTSRALNTALVAVASAVVVALSTPAAHAQETIGGISLAVRTLPAVEGVSFWLDGQRFTSDSDGVARTAVPAPGVYELRAVAHKLLEPGRRIDFSQWSDGTTAATRTVSIATSTELVAGYDTTHIVRETFVDAAGDPLRAAALDSFTIVDDAGTAQTLPATTSGLRGPTALLWQRYPPGARWLVATRVVAEGDALAERDVTYTVEHVAAKGAVLPATSGPFDPSVGDKWRIEVSAFPVTLGARPLLLGATQVPISVALPDGTKIVEQSGASVLLPRGTSTVRAGGGGLPISTTVEVPETTSATARIITPADGTLVVVALGAATAAVALRGRKSVRDGHARGAPPAPPLEQAPRQPLRAPAASVARPAASAQPAPPPPEKTAPPPPPEPTRPSAPPEARPAEDTMPYVRITLHSGRVIEGRAKGELPSSDSDVWLVEVAAVRDLAGQEVQSTPLDSFLVRSRIARVEQFEDGSQLEGRPKLRLVENELSAGPDDSIEGGSRVS